MTTSERAPRGRPRQVALDEAITDATMAMLAEVGFSGLTMEGIAARAGTGKANVYRRWQSKTALVVDVLSQLVEPIPPPQGDTAEEAVQGILLEIYDRMFVSKWRDVVLSVVGEISREPELAALYQEKVVRPRIAALEAVLAEGVASGQIRDDLPPILMVRLLLGPLAYSVLIEGEMDDRAMIERIAEEVWRVIRAPSRRRRS